jgi:AmpD protein
MRFEIDRNGWVPGIPHVPSPNADERPAGEPVELIVIHGISLPPGEFGGADVERLFTNAIEPQAHPYFAQLVGLRVSAHFFVRRDGAVIQFVSCLRRAWHAGLSLWSGRPRCNDYSIGIELEGADDVAYEARQYAVCNAIIAAAVRAFPIRDVVGHSDIAPGRKTDPGPCFDWSMIERPTFG